MGTVCMQCGDRGFPNAFVDCVKCLDTSVHRYCLDVIPDTLDEYVHWVCDDCETEARNHDYDAIPSQTRNIISKNIGGFSKVGKKITDSLVVQTEVHVYKDGPERSYDACTRLDLAEHCEPASEGILMQLVGKSDKPAVLPADERKTCQQSSSQQLEEEKAKGDLMQHSKLSDGALKKNKRKKRRSKESAVEKDQHGLCNTPSKQSCEERLIIDIRDSECTRLTDDSTLPSKVKENDGLYLQNKCAKISIEENNFNPGNYHIEDRESEGIEEGTSAPRHGSNFCKDLVILSAEPVVMPIWRGSFNIWHKKRFILEGLLAHMSSKACGKVYEAACQFEPMLQLRLLPRSDVWPKSFETSEPSGDSIALYFFPSEISERTFDHLVDKMMRKELALKASVQNAELLIFTSTELPLLYWRFQGKYYLWGVFRGKQSTPSHSRSGSAKLENNPIVPIELLNDTEGNISGTMKRCGTRSPLSPLSYSASYGSSTF